MSRYRDSSCTFFSRDREDNCALVVMPLGRVLTNILHRYLSPWLSPSAAGCSSPSMPFIVLCLLLSCSRLFSPSVLCRLAIFYLVVPLISSLSLVALCAAFVPPIVLHFCYMSDPSPLLFQCVIFNANYLCSLADL